MNYYTHSGFFHADEVFGYAICHLASVCDNVVRVEDLNNIPTDGVIADIGREWEPKEMKFDHHQGFFPRENGIPYASAGMLWKHWGEDVVSSFTNRSENDNEIAARVDETLIQGIDAHDADNRYYHEATCSAGRVRALTISNMIALMNTDDPSNYMVQKDAFHIAANTAMRIIRQSVLIAKKHIEAKDKFLKVATNYGEVIVLSEGLPWKEIVHESYPEALFIISPSNHPGNPYSMVAVPVEPEKREIKKPIERPEWFDGFIHQGKWIAGGKDEKELRRLADFNIN